MIGRKINFKLPEEKYNLEGKVLDKVRVKEEGTTLGRVIHAYLVEGKYSKVHIVKPDQIISLG